MGMAPVVVKGGRRGARGIGQHPEFFQAACTFLKVYTSVLVALKQQREPSFPRRSSGRSQSHSRKCHWYAHQRIPKHPISNGCTKPVEDGGRHTI
ncbi:hypothetical protein BDZ91DRAFT_728242 [Kalaharituber pfeilii]|nr:hypothetical protein BDZ91DRAFT_728242 [Kalaharituber pfeilii]